MRLSYYDNFKCTADKCEFTCCQEWKISVDENTEEKWKKLGFSHCVCDKDGERVIKLNEQKKCPFLDKNKLCGIVISHGYDKIPHTCDVFPRQIHQFDNRTEHALVSCCPEVINILNQIDINDMVAPLFKEKYDFMYQLRNLVIRQIKESVSCSLGMKVSFYILLDCIDKIEEGCGEEEIINGFDDKYLSEIEEAISQIDVNLEIGIKEVNELFLDVVENYRKQGIYTNYLEDISKVAEQFSEQMGEDSIQDTDMTDKEFYLELCAEYKGFQNYIKQYDLLCKKYLISELFADGLLEDSDVYDLTIMLQWFAIEYALIKHSVFLLFYGNIKGEKMVSKEQYKIKFGKYLSEYMVIVSRMMGYNREDIYEYMEECFNDTIWEWGYFSTLLLSSIFENVPK